MRASSQCRRSPRRHRLSSRQRLNQSANLRQLRPPFGPSGSATSQTRGAQARPADANAAEAGASQARALAASRAVADAAQPKSFAQTCSVCGPGAGCPQSRTSQAGTASERDPPDAAQSAQIEGGGAARRSDPSPGARRRLSGPARVRSRHRRAWTIAAQRSDAFQLWRHAKRGAGAARIARGLRQRRFSGFEQC